MALEIPAPTAAAFYSSHLEGCGNGCGLSAILSREVDARTSSKMLSFSPVLTQICPFSAPCPKGKPAGNQRLSPI